MNTIEFSKSKIAISPSSTCTKFLPPKEAWAKELNSSLKKKKYIPEAKATNVSNILTPRVSNWGAVFRNAIQPNIEKIK